MSIENQVQTNIEALTTPGAVTPPDLSTLITTRIMNALAFTNCHLIGTIIQFYPETQTADISISMVKILNNAPEPSKNVLYPKLVSCPVVILQGGGGALTFPIIPGDPCLVLFNDRDMDSWYQSGQTALPNSARMHDLSDGIALVGLNPSTTSLATYLTSGVQLSYKTSNVTLQENSAALIHGDNVVSVEDKVKIAVGLNTLLEALDALCSALISASITGGAFSAGTITDLTNAKSLIDGVLK